MDLIEHMINGAKTNPRMAKGLRELLVKGLSEHQEGSEAHSHLLETLNSLDTFIAREGSGYSKDRVTGGEKCF